MWKRKFADNKKGCASCVLTWGRWGWIDRDGGYGPPARPSARKLPTLAVFTPSSTWCSKVTHYTKPVTRHSFLQALQHIRKQFAWWRQRLFASHVHRVGKMEISLITAQSNWNLNNSLLFQTSYKAHCSTIIYGRAKNRVFTRHASSQDLLTPKIGAASWPKYNSNRLEHEAHLRLIQIHKNNS